MSDCPQVSLYDEETTAQRAQITVAQLWRLTRKGRFPQPLRIGCRKLFRSDEVHEWTTARNAQEIVDKQT